MSKSPPPAEDGNATKAGAARPRTVVAATIALAVSALAALGAATALYGQTSWLQGEQRDANSSAASSAVSQAVASASSSHSDVASASSSVASVNQTKYPTTGAKLDDQVSQQQRGGLIMSLVLALATAFVAFGVFNGRHWSRWGVLAFWAIASFTGTFAGFTYLVIVGADLPGVFKVSVFISALSMLAAVVLCQLRPSVEYFDVLDAPSKKLVWFERSGHEPFVDEPAKFNAAMADLVRPALAGELVPSAG